MAKIRAALLLSAFSAAASAQFADTASPYATTLDLGSCDVQITETNGLTAANGAGRVFCLNPGTYNGVTLTASGTAAAPRILKYYNPSNPNDTRHPVDMTTAEQARITSIVRMQGNNWIISGVTFQGNTAGSETILVGEGGQNVTFDRLLVQGGGSGAGQVRLETNYTLQSSVLRSTWEDASDAHCSVIGGGHDDVTIVGNEFYNCGGDCVQNHPGTSTNILIADNDMYQTAAMAFGTSEQAIDTKASTGATLATGFRVRDNRIWSINRDDLSVNNTAIIFSRNVIKEGVFDFRGNVISDTPTMIRSTGPTAPAGNVSIVNNVFYDSGGTLQVRGWNASEIYHNTIVDASGEWILDTGATADDMDILGNVLIDALGHDPMGGTGNVADYNAYYNSSQYAAPGTNDITFASSASTNSDQYCYERRRWTGPEVACIPNVETTTTSPHKNLTSGANIGSRAGIGVDNVALTYTDAGVSVDDLLGGPVEPPPPGGEPAFATSPGCKLTLQPPFIQCVAIEFAADCKITSSQTVPAWIQVSQDTCEDVEITAGVTLTVNGTFLYPDDLGDPPTYTGSGTCTGSGCN